MASTPILAPARADGADQVLSSCSARALRWIAIAVALCGLASLAGCASGGAGDGASEEGGAGLDDAATVGVDGATAVDTGAGRSDVDATGVSPGIDSGTASGVDSSTSGEDGGDVADSGGGGGDDGSSSSDDSGSPPVDSGGGGTVATACPNSAVYAIEAIAAAASGSPTFCPLSATQCPSTDCCYEQTNPISVCVAK